MHKKSLLAVAVCVTALAGVGAAPAFAGEITGPPGTPDRAGSALGKPTGAVTHSNSICAFNGLNDMNPLQGPIHFIVQTPHTQGSPGEAGHGTCRGGTNFHNPPG